MPPANGRGEPSALEAIALESLPLEPETGEVLRYLGYPRGAAPGYRVAERVEAAVRVAGSRMRPRGAYALYNIASRGRRSLVLGGGARFSGAIAEYLRAARRAAVFVATAGPEIVGLAEEALRGGDALGGLIYNAIGSQAAEGAVEALMDDLRRRILPGEALTLRYSPGYCGITLRQQETLFRLVDAARVGVQLLPSLIMKPLKSVSGIVGVGPREEIGAAGSPCERCPLLDCRMRR